MLRCKGETYVRILYNNPKILTYLYLNKVKALFNKVFKGFLESSTELT